MNSRNNEIKSIKTGKCEEGDSCQHYIKITYQNGQQQGFQMRATQIAGLFWKYLNKEDKDHFEYVTKPDNKFYEAYLAYKNLHLSVSIFHSPKNNPEENKKTSSKSCCIIL